MTTTTLDTVEADTVKGIRNKAAPLSALGVSGLKAAYFNYRDAGLTQEAVARGEGEIGIGGAFLTTTGKHTGRSPKDKFVVDEPSVKDSIWWENNPPMDPAAFDRLKADMFAHMKGREYFVQDLFGGSDPAYRL
ncbi:MAG: phosphoenolpyruvate carboxykinase (ATP), partial [Pseudomonadota bacterium]